MKPVKIYTYAQWRPDFISIQYESLKRFIKDDFEYIVFNNGVESNEQRVSVRKECDKIGVQCVDVVLDTTFNNVGGIVSFSGNKYLNPNLACSYPLVWSWSLFEQQRGSIIAVVDSDMFFMRDFCFNDYCNTFSFIPQYRGIHPNNLTADVFYPWNGFFVVDVDCMPNMSELNWHCGSVNGYAVDVGGQAHHYLKRYKNEIKSMYFDIYCVYEIDNTSTGKNIHFTQNGNCNFWVGIDNGVRQIRYTEPTTQDHKNVFPYEVPVNNYIELKKEKALYLYDKYIYNKQTYPPPVYIDFMEEYTNFNRPFVDPFIIHYKSGSNYNNLSPDYHMHKTNFLKNFLNNL